MMRLLKTEYLKINRYWIFWGMVFITFAAIATAFWGIDSILNDFRNNAVKNSPIPIPEVSIYQFPGIWHNLTYIAGSRLFLLFPALIMVLLITNEITFRTLRQNVIDGYSRNETFVAKFLVAIGISVMVTAFVFVNGLILGFLHSPASEWKYLLSKTSFVLAFFLEVVAFTSFALMIGLLVKKSIFAMGVLAIWAVIADPIITHYLGDWYKQFMPINSITTLIELPNSILMKMFGMQFKEFIELTDLLIVLAWTTVFNGISWYILKIRNL